jgi:hypothetical protein
MKDTIKEADLLLAGIIGYATPDYPRWTQGNLTVEENQKLDRERNQQRLGNIGKGRYLAIKREIETRSRSNYDYLYPRRPSWWDDVITAYLDLPDDVRSELTKDDIEFLIEYMHPDSVRERKAQAKREKQAAKERTADARKVRNDPVNKEADRTYDPRGKEKWAQTDDIDELAWKLDGSVKPIMIFKAKHDGGYWRWYYGKFERLINFIDWRKKHPYREPPYPLQSITSAQSSMNLEGIIYLT